MADVPFRVAEWLNSDSSTVNTFVGEACVQCLNTKEPTELIPVVARLKQFVESNDEIHKLFKQAFQELPLKTPYDKDPIGNPQIRDFNLFLRMLNVVLSSPPRFEKHDYVGLPISAMLNWITYTPSGLVLFANAELNAHIKAVLDHWSVFLSSPDSRRYLTTEEGNGWFSPAAVSKCVGANNQLVPFEDLYECDPTKPYFGFTSWDAYFTRLFKQGQRPVADADNDSIIVNACESCPYKLATNVKLDDQFWIKGQPYSMRHMLQDDKLASYFAGGTVYQAYLSSMSYHRWHCPVNGRVKAIKMIPGAYFANCPSIGYDPTICDSQCYQTEVSTRCLIYIESNNAAIGLMCFMAIGMGEVSTCEVTVNVGDAIKKGDELGLFHFGGSSHCLIFGPQVNLKFKFGPDDKIGLGSTIQLLNANLAEVM